MTVEPPSSGRPTGPPSGPLSGPSQPPSGPPTEPPASGGGPVPPPGDGSGGGVPPGSPSSPGSAPGGPSGPHRPWWRSVPRVAVLAAVLVVAVVLGVVLTRSGDSGGSGSGSGDSGGSGEVFLQAADKTGPDPFTESSATDSSAPPASLSPAPSASANTVRGVDGGAPGLYGGTRDVASCDVEKQVDALRAAPAKNRAFASVAGVAPDRVPAYLRALTPVQLRMDTRVTNHGYRDGTATPYQAVLQSGTAVLVDAHGVPRVRCACGNPLTPPVAQQGTLKRTGDSWPAYRPSDVVVITPSTTVVDVFVLYDPDDKGWFTRERGDTGGKDRPTDRPSKPAEPSRSASSSAEPSGSPDTSTSPPASESPATDSPAPPSDSGTPSSEAPPPSGPSTEPESAGGSTPEQPGGDTPQSAPSTADPAGPGGSPLL
ncbi:DUF6777 domain-containing protein [Streptomyces sp. NPDC091281]|uniref:DUF6777 domain-containing protein n=1 Tax=Streptomyces sp. NPDC091281 TaxID=3365985 RepID=UPI00380DF059